MSGSETLRALRARWDTFESKVSGRLAEVLAEADAGFDDLIATEVLDPAPFSGAVTTFEARLRGLQQKVEEAHARLEGDLDGVDADEVGQEEINALAAALRRAAGALSERIEAEGGELVVRKGADAARALKALADAEQERARTERTCAGCHAPISPKVLHEACNVTCPFCNVVNTYRPGLATEMFYKGDALHRLAQEAAGPARGARAAAERAYKALRYPTEEDLRRFGEAELAYWRAWCKARGELTPGWDPGGLEREAKGRASALEQVYAGDRRERARNSAAAQALAGGEAALRAWLEGEGADWDREELTRHALEHGQRRSAELLLGLAYEDESPDEPKEAWIAARLRELGEQG